MCTTATPRCPGKPGGNHSKAQAQNLPASTGNNYYLHANLRGAKMLPWDVLAFPWSEAVSQTLINHPIYTRQWEHLSHTLKNTTFNPAHTARALFVSFSRSEQRRCGYPIHSCIQHFPQVFKSRLYGVWSNLSHGRCPWLWQGSETRLSSRSLPNINYPVMLRLAQCFHILSCSIIRCLIWFHTLMNSCVLLSLTYKLTLVS